MKSIFRAPSLAEPETNVIIRAMLSSPTATANDWFSKLTINPINGLMAKLNTRAPLAIPMSIPVFCIKPSKTSAKDLPNLGIKVAAFFMLSIESSTKENASPITGISCSGLRPVTWKGWNWGACRSDSGPRTTFLKPSTAPSLRESRLGPRADFPLDIPTANPLAICSPIRINTLDGLAISRASSAASIAPSASSVAAISTVWVEPVNPLANPDPTLLPNEFSPPERARSKRISPPDWPGSNPWIASPRSWIFLMSAGVIPSSRYWVSTCFISLELSRYSGLKCPPTPGTIASFWPENGRSWSNSPIKETASSLIAWNAPNKGVPIDRASETTPRCLSISWASRTTKPPAECPTIFIWAFGFCWWTE